MTTELLDDGVGGVRGDGYATPTRATYLVKRLESAVRQDLDARMQAQGLTTPQYAALSILLRSPGLSSAQLARRSFVTAQSMQVMVTAFVRNGYIERRPDPEKQRILRNYLTAEGTEVLSRCESEADAMEDRMLAGLSAAQIVGMRDAMAACIRNLSGPVEH
ncbi:MarR family winged helix-turn-helix transcriptional regulator [Rhodococcus qingshengii]|uniref:MarR family winged helix-turn-helix transcriptional regulator n=1 Tax=Rhodococcus qingshengii TaxID=334542 RepID=UPI0021BAB176|nr:MarR family transcriptional regulator [Rhodococcus qingshengii]UXF67268.1 MarR family transcriptional regulator [Rhodococcus qingshengii]